MVKLSERLKRNLLSSMTLSLFVASGHVTNANEFYTIIGPDGRPMVIQRQSNEKLKKEKPVIENKTTQQVETPKVKTEPVLQIKKEQQPNLKKNENSSSVKTPVITSSFQNNQQQEQIVIQKEPKQEKVIPTIEVPKQKEQIKDLKTQENSSEQSVQSPKVVPENKPEKSVTTINVKPTPQNEEVIQSTESIKNQPQQQKNKALEATDDSKTKEKKGFIKSLFGKDSSSSKENNVLDEQNTPQAYSVVDGEKYVNNEYLENKEFNLENKKRFYAMPEGVIDIKNGGGSRIQVVEREKGVNKNVIDRIFKPEQIASNTPIVLSATYFRVPKEEAIDGLGQTCIVEKELKKSKKLHQDRDVNLWPRAPLKDHFDYELVKVDPVIRNIQVNSYATKIENPTFYWPFIIFLDEKGCVVEGAGGFKNSEAQPNLLKHEVIDGMIQVPESTHYLLLTPLASAVDMENHNLSNQGQLKLIAVR